MRELFLFTIAASLSGCIPALLSMQGDCTEKRAYDRHFGITASYRDERLVADTGDSPSCAEVCEDLLLSEDAVEVGVGDCTLSVFDREADDPSQVVGQVRCSGYGVFRQSCE